VNPELFESAAERELYSAVRGAATKVQNLKRAGKYQDALEAIAGLRKVVDQFFDGVMVMAENEAVRGNRLALLANCCASSRQWPIFLKLAVKSGVSNLKYYLNYLKSACRQSFPAAVAEW